MNGLIRVTIACPVAAIADANQLARCVGYDPADDQTFGEANCQDASGNLYAVASGPVKPAFVLNAVSPLVEPAWGADLAAAARAQALISVYDPAVSGQPFAAPDRIAAVVDLDPAAARAVLGLF